MVFGSNSCYAGELLSDIRASFALHIQSEHFRIRINDNNAEHWRATDNKKQEDKIYRDEQSVGFSCD